MAMEMDHSFTVPVPPDQAWDVLLDVKRIAPCMPGATVDAVDGDIVTGHIKVKVGPVSLTYRGTANFGDRDPAARTILVEASGKETRGAGTASATVRASLEPSGDDATAVTMHTTMNVTGRPAQFGRGVMVEVGGKLVEQFAQNLAQLITTDFATDKGSAEESGDQPGDAGSDAADSADADATTGSGTTGAGSNANGTGTIAAGGTTASSAPAPAPPAADHINMIRLVGPSLLKRIVPVAAIAAGLALLGRRFWHRAHKGTGA
jgi:carbon monoxide dehydrogenase subunit G